MHKGTQIFCVVFLALPSIISDVSPRYLLTRSFANFLQMIFTVHIYNVPSEATFECKE